MVGMFAREARVRPYASLRLEMTRMIWAGRESEDEDEDEDEGDVLSITAWRLVPVPEIRIVRRVGCVMVIVIVIGGALDWLGRLEGVEDWRCCQ